MEEVITDLKINVVDKTSQQLQEKTKLKIDLERRVDILNSKLKFLSDQLNSYKISNTNTIQDNTKLEHLNERVSIEISHIKMELSLLRQRVDSMKQEIFDRDRETTKLKHEIYSTESEVDQMREETRIMSKSVIQMQKDKQNMRAAVVLLKKQVDMIRERVIKEDCKSKDFIREVSTLLERGKLNG